MTPEPFGLPKCGENEAYVEVRFFLDSAGMPRVVFPVGYEILADALRDLMFVTPEDCDEVLAAVDRVRQGEIADWAAGGNSSSIEIHADRVVIENEFAPPHKLEVDVSHFVEFVSQWRSLVAQRNA